jgi:integrase
MSRHAAHKVQLREFSVKKAKPKSKPYVVWDAHQRGLALRVQPTGTKAWFAIYSRQGRSRWLYLGSADAVPLSEARIMAAEAMLAVARGGDPADDKKAERGAGTFAELAGKYVELYAKRHNKSWKQAEALVRRFAIPKWGKLPATTITRGDVKALMARIAAPIVANQTLAALSAIFSWGMREEIITANPCKMVAGNPTKSRDRVLSESEVALFWKEFDAVGGVKGSALKAILLTGQRPGEVRHMRREHIVDSIDPKTFVKNGSWWQMPGAPVETLNWPGTKNGENHRVWLPASVLELIGNGATGFVFPGRRGRPVPSLDGIMRKISAKFGKFGGEPAKPHDLRRTHGSTITALGFGRDAMNRIQNHIEGGIADVYDQHEYAKENRRIMETVAGHLMGLVEGRGDDGDDQDIRPDRGVIDVIGDAGADIGAKIIPFAGR